MLKKNNDIDMTSGAILPKLLKLSLPLMLSSVLQLLFNAADIIVVGNFASDARIKRCAAVDGGEELLANVLGKICAHGLGVEYVFAVEVDVCGCCGEVSAGVFAGDFLDSF